MKARACFIVMFAIALLSGCATPTQNSVQLDQTALAGKTGRIGVGSTILPKIEMQVPGASCLLCLIAATAANSSLSSHASTLPYEDLPKVKEMIAERLRKKGLDVVVIPEDINLDTLDDFRSDKQNSARKNFAPLQKNTMSTA